MRPVMTALMICGFILALSGEVHPGRSRAQLRASVPSGNSAAGFVVRGGSTYRYAYSVYGSYYPPVVVISPYSQPYYVSPTVVATSPYFCVFHNDGFVSRVGLLDHLSGMHRIPLDMAASLCPDGTGSCIFPSY
jgi:hypothetical protein